MTRRRALAAGLLGAGLLGSCGGDRREELATFNTVPAFTLTDQAGEEFRSDAALKGKVWIADFIFTTCTGPCPRMSSQMKRVQTELKDLPGVELVSFTVDPDNDTPSALAEYAKRFAADTSRWRSSML